MTALFNPENFVNAPIQEGDAGLILRKDGSFEIFNTHAAIDPNNLTERQIEQAETLEAFALAMQIPDILNLLKKMTKDPNIVQHPVNLGIKH